MSSNDAKAKQCKWTMIVAGVLVVAILFAMHQSKPSNAEKYIAPTPVAGLPVPSVSSRPSEYFAVSPEEVLGGFGIPVAFQDVPRLQAIEAVSYSKKDDKDMAVYYLQHSSMDRAKVRNIL